VASQHERRAPVITAAWLRSAATQCVFGVLEAGGHTARAVGGSVRNSLLALPVSDIDIATDALPEQTLKLAKAAGLSTIPTGLSHGTVTVMAQGIVFEVTTLRRDVATDGRHADVAFTTDWVMDASRRDFTINALYCDRHGEIFDPLGGLRDLAPLRIRFIGDARQRITEDYLRILRFFRFTATYAADGSFDVEGLRACADLSTGLARISGERIAVELLKLLAAPHAIEAVVAMADSGIFTAAVPIVPHVADTAKLAEIENHLGKTADPLLRLGALGVVSLVDAHKLNGRLKLSTADHKRITATVRNGPLIVPNLSTRDAKALVYRLGVARFIDAVLIAWCRSPRSPDDQAYTDLIALSDSWAAPTLPLNGHDVAAAGVKLGPEIGRTLAALEDEWIASDFQWDRDRLLEALAHYVKRASSPAS
jgi:poly(A) polymerase